MVTVVCCHRYELWYNVWHLKRVCVWFVEMPWPTVKCYNNCTSCWRIIWTAFLKRNVRTVTLLNVFNDSVEKVLVFYVQLSNAQSRLFWIAPNFQYTPYRSRPIFITSKLVPTSADSPHIDLRKIQNESKENLWLQKPIALKLIMSWFY